MLSKEPLNEQEKRYLGALKLFFEAHPNPEHPEAAKEFDELPPDAQRYLINLYHLALEDPVTYLRVQKMMPWLMPILKPFFAIYEFFEKIFRRLKR